MPGGYAVGDLVWVKTGSWAWWPALVYDSAKITHIPRPSGGQVLVHYFGEDSFTWVTLPTKELRPYRKHPVETKMRKHKSVRFAVERADSFEAGEWTFDDQSGDEEEESDASSGSAGDDSSAEEEEEEEEEGSDVEMEPVVKKTKKTKQTKKKVVRKAKKPRSGDTLDKHHPDYVPVTTKKRKLPAATAGETKSTVIVKPVIPPPDLDDSKSAQQLAEELQVLLQATKQQQQNKNKTNNKSKTPATPAPVVVVAAQKQQQKTPAMVVNRPVSTALDAALGNALSGILSTPIMKKTKGPTARELERKRTRELKQKAAAHAANQAKMKQQKTPAKATVFVPQIMAFEEPPAGEKKDPQATPRLQRKSSSASRPLLLTLEDVCDANMTLEPTHKLYARWHACGGNFDLDVDKAEAQLRTREKQKQTKQLLVLVERQHQRSSSSSSSSNRK
jgi:hypothetical protein